MRRIHVREVVAGAVEVGAEEAHHAREVLRLKEGAEVEVFDEAGRRGRGTVARVSGREFVVEVESVEAAPEGGFAWTIASAIPKGSRVDWMIEKLSELGTDRFVPLHAARSVVLPEGTGKRQRWERLAGEAAKQSRRNGVMHIDELTTTAKFLASIGQERAWYFSTSPGAVSIVKAAEDLVHSPLKALSLYLLIGPEGGWSDEEIRLFDSAGLTAVSLGATILRVETAAVAAATVAAAVVAPMMDRFPSNEHL